MAMQRRILIIIIRVNKYKLNKENESLDNSSLGKMYITVRKRGRIQANLLMGCSNILPDSIS